MKQFGGVHYANYQISSAPPHKHELKQAIYNKLVQLTESNESDLQHSYSITEVLDKISFLHEAHCVSILSYHILLSPPPPAMAPQVPREPAAAGL